MFAFGSETRYVAGLFKEDDLVSSGLGKKGDEAGGRRK